MLVDEEEGSTDNICRARAALGRSSSESLVSPLLRCVAWGDELGKGVVAGLVDVGLELELELEAAGEAAVAVVRPKIALMESYEVDTCDGWLNARTGGGRDALVSCACAIRRCISP